MSRLPSFSYRFKAVFCLLLAIGLGTTGFADTSAAEKRAKQVEKLVKPSKAAPKNYSAYPNVELKTNMGEIIVQLNAVRAPISSKNFLQYVENGHYNGTIFHRVIPGFVAQGGGHMPNYSELVTRDPIFNESGNGLSNLTGTIAMARESNPHSATSQFYINLADNTRLDPRSDRWGYTVFGEVRYGMKILQKVASMPTGAGGSFEKDVPIKPLIINTARVMGPDELIPVESLSMEDIIKEEEEAARRNQVTDPARTPARIPTQNNRQQRNNNSGEGETP